MNDPGGCWRLLRQRRIEVALQRRELANLVAIPAQFRAGVKEGQPLITSIEAVVAPAADFEPRRSPANSDQEAFHANDH